MLLGVQGDLVSVPCLSKFLSYSQIRHSEPEPKDSAARSLKKSMRARYQTTASRRQNARQLGSLFPDTPIWKRSANTWSQTVFCFGSRPKQKPNEFSRPKQRQNKLKANVEAIANFSNSNKTLSFFN